MSSSIEWNLKIALSLTFSLKQFVNLNYAHTSSPYVDESLNDLEKTFNNYPNWQGMLFRNLEETLNLNGWIISSLDESLRSLKEKKRILIAEGEILIIKGYIDENVSAIVKEGSSCYFLVAALTCNGKILYHWKLKTWRRVNPKLYAEKASDSYYFYYCKVTPKSLIKFLRLEDISEERPWDKILGNIWNSTQNNLKIFEYDEISIRDSYEEERKHEIIRKYNELVQKFNSLEEESQVKILNLEAKINELELENEKHKEFANLYQLKENELRSMENKCSLLEDNIKTFIKTIKDQANEINKLKYIIQNKNETDKTPIDLQTEKEIQEAENSSLKIALEKEHQTQNLTNSNIMNSKIKIIQEKPENINETNYSLSFYSRENESFMLPPNTKHGLPNFGNTCYLNSLLQIFASTPLFKSKIEYVSSQFCNSLWSLVSGMHNENNSKTISNLTQNFYQNLIEAYSNRKQHSQQDVKEVFNMILSKVEEDGGNLDIFSIVFHQIFTCRNSDNHHSEYSDIQSFLIIPPQHKDSISYYLQNQICSSLSTQSLFCDKCEEIVDTNISIKRTDWPAYLVLYFPSSPNSIDESIYINSNNIYELYGAICYYQNEGNSHYTAFTKDGNEWNEYNDEHVETKAMSTHFANLVFYSKKGSSFYYASYNY